MRKTGTSSKTTTSDLRSNALPQEPDSAANEARLRCDHANRTSEQMATSAGAGRAAGRALRVRRAHHGGVLPAVMPEPASTPRFGGILCRSARSRACRISRLPALQADADFRAGAVRAARAAMLDNAEGVVTLAQLSKRWASARSTCSGCSSAPPASARANINRRGACSTSKPDCAKEKM